MLRLIHADVEPSAASRLVDRVLRLAAIDDRPGPLETSPPIRFAGSWWNLEVWERLDDVALRGLDYLLTPARLDDGRPVVARWIRYA